ncbi:hypothetical protein ASF40_16900 [Microbacterium sp. Leaf288]|uniref:AAA family ATPase n=1 Tax=Microbacterium sp. Leaf288 TaxID=1736323 RepID=UPI0006F88815|nr:AAA family ATPase [Microbacterium sp. Leaf288]KQP69537.1 hypothetical protein ASF40_16900 [Microbacterium sp. Leaf288]
MTKADRLTPARRELREATATLASFQGGWLEASAAGEVDPEQSIVDFLLDDCVKVRDHSGAAAWTLDPAVRRDTLKRLGTRGAQERRAQAPRVPDGPTQAAIDRILRGEGPAPAELSAADLRAELQVVRWFDGIVSRSDDHENAARRRLGRLEVLQPLTDLLRFGFVGRGAELERIARHIDVDDGRALVISGVGGVGKSTLLARAVVDAVDLRGEVLVAYLNFDRGALRTDDSAGLLAEILAQTSLQSPDTSRESPMEMHLAAVIDELRRQEEADLGWYGLSSRSIQGNTYKSANSRTRPGLGVNPFGRTNPYLASPTSGYDDLLGAAADLLEGFGADRVVLLLDTFEEVERNQESDLFLLWDFLGYLRRRISSLRIIVSGRALDPQDFDDRFVVRTLDELDEESAITLLTTQDGLEVSESQARLITARFGRSPLTLRLVTDLLKHDDDDGLFEAGGTHDSLDGTSLLDGIQAGLVQGQLYSRILWHIADPDVRKLAHPGLVVRVITPDIIREVLAVPCELDVTTEPEALGLFRALAEEATLVEVDGEVLRHRADVRSRMLSWLLLDRRDQARAIHVAAIDYYRARETVEDRAEELYHMLMVGSPSDELDDRWDDRAYRLLKPSRDELPPRGRAYLAARSGGDLRIDDDVSSHLDDAGWIRSTESNVRSLVQAGQLEVALDTLRSRRGSLGESLLPLLEIEVLEDLRRFDEALEVIQSARRVSLDRSGDDEFELRLRLAESRVLERMGRFHNAADTARQARELAARVAEPIDVLIATVEMLRTMRRGGEMWDLDALADSATDLAESIPFIDLEVQPGLVRELLGEIGTRSQRLFELGVGIIGVESGTSARVDRDLTERGLLFDDNDDQLLPPREHLVTRGTTGDRVQGYLLNAGGDDRLADSIVQQWRDESDRLYS